MAHVGPHAMDQAQIMLDNSPATQAQMDMTQRMVHDGKALSVLLSKMHFQGFLYNCVWPSK